LQRYHLPEPRSNLSEVLADGSAAFQTDDRVVLFQSFTLQDRHVITHTIVSGICANQSTSDFENFVGV
jgi:hypothetical protein